MPKSKKRKGRYTPRPPRAQQQTASAIATTSAKVGEAATPAVAPRPAAPAPKTAASARPGSSGPRMPIMTQVNVSTELKVIGILTLALFAVIVVLYFVLR